jgi:hypothetical protein
MNPNKRAGEMSPTLKYAFDGLEDMDSVYRQQSSYIAGCRRFA